jgi:hypothetical protein
MDTVTEERYFLCGPCLDVLSRILSAVQESEELVGELVSELRYSRCELLLSEVRTSAVGSRYEATTGKDIAGWKRLSV